MSNIRVNWHCSGSDGKFLPFTFPDNGIADLFQLVPPFCGRENSVTIRGTFELDEPVTAVFGVAADGCWLFKVNGGILLDARVSGNSENPLSPDNHPFEIDLEPGRHCFELEVFGKNDTPETYPVAFKQLPDRGKLEFKYQPVTAFPDAEEDAISVIFAGSVPSPGAVDYRLSGETSWQRVYDSRAGQIRRDLARHHIRLEDLAPESTYEYRAVLVDDLRQMSDAVYSECGVFRTPAKQGAFSFVATSDLQDKGSRLRYLEKLLGKNSPFKMDFFAYIGDVFWTTDCDHTVMDEFIVPFRNSSGNTVPLVMVRGNHETYGREWYKYLEYFAMPEPGRDGYGMFRIGEVCFVVLDFCDDAPNTPQPSTRCFHDFEPYISRQTKWLKRAVKSAVFREAKFRIVLAHGTPVGDSREYLPGHVRQVIDPVFGSREPEAKIHLYLGGHIHRPFRSIPCKAACYSVCDPRKLQVPHPVIGEEYAFPVVIMGGPSKITQEIFHATCIKVDVSESRIDVSSFDINNQEFDRFSIDEEGRIFAEKRRDDFKYFEY